MPDDLESRFDYGFKMENWHIYMHLPPNINEMKIEDFVEKFGEPYSKRLGIDLASGRNDEFVKWLLASILYAKPIRESSATRTYKTFEAHGSLSVDTILDRGWGGLVQMLDEGGYVRYDFSTATKLLEVFNTLKRDYDSDLWNLYRLSSDGVDLEVRLKALGKGVGEATVSIFLRDMRGIWKKADPKPTPMVRMAMEKLGIADLKDFAKGRNLDVIWLETALLRLAKDFLRRGKEVDISL